MGSIVTGPRGWFSRASLRLLMVFLNRSFSRLGVLKSLTDALRPNRSFQMGVARPELVLVDMMTPFGSDAFSTGGVSSSSASKPDTNALTDGE